MAALSPIESEFATSEEAIAYDRWFRTKVEAALDERQETFPHAVVMKQIRAIIDEVSR